MQINIRNIRINSISTIGSLNIGKTVFSENQASSARFPKPYYEENEPENGNEDDNNEGDDFISAIDVPVIGLPPGF